MDLPEEEIEGYWWYTPNIDDDIYNTIRTIIMSECDIDSSNNKVPTYTHFQLLRFIDRGALFKTKLPTWTVQAITYLSSPEANKRFAQLLKDLTEERENQILSAILALKSSIASISNTLNEPNYSNEFEISKNNDSDTA